MAIFYVRSTDGNDADNGSTWALAKATLAGAYTAAAAGDTIYVSDDHAETPTANYTLTSPGTAANPIYVICVDDAAEPPTALATTATVSVSGNFQLNISGFAYFYGIAFSGRTTGTAEPISIGNLSTVPQGMVFDNCIISFGSGYTGSGTIRIGYGITGTDDQFYKFINCTFRAHHANNAGWMFLGGYVDIIGGSVTTTAATPPTTLFSAATTSGSGRVNIVGLDMTIADSGENILLVSHGSPIPFTFRNCKLGASVALTTGAVAGPGGCRAEFINCDSADTNYRYWYQDYAGTIEHETTIVRTGGATDGITPISREMISNANTKLIYQLILKDLTIWNETVGSSVTVTVHIITDNVTLTDQECWLEVEYLGTSGIPLALLANDADSITDILLGGSASNQTTSTETWTTTGLTTPVKQQLSVSVTPQEKGPIRCRVVLTKPSTTVYVCPKIEIS